MAIAGIVVAVVKRASSVLLISGYIFYTFYCFQSLDKFLQFACVFQHYGKSSAEESVKAVYANASQQDFFFFRDNAGDVVDDSQVVIAHYMQCNGVLRASFPGPASLDNAVSESLAQLWRIGAVCTVYLYSVAVCDKTEYLITINRLAAFGHLEIYAFQVLVNDHYVIYLL